MSTTTTALTVGTLVTVDPEAGFPAHVATQVYRITKVPVGRNGVNYTAAPVNGGRGIKCPGTCFAPFEGTEQEARDYRPGPVVMEYIPAPNMGTVVRVSNVRQIDPKDLYVVLGEARKPNAAKIARLGGSDGARYYPSIPVKNLMVVTLDRISVSDDA